jgi:hypothetical protein
MHIPLRSFWCLSLFVVLGGCGGGPDKPRSMEEIDQERTSLPALFLTKSGHRVIAPGNRGVFVDEESGEIAWPAYECGNPNCPGKGENGEPAVFYWGEPRFYLKEDGALGARDFETAQDWRDALAAEGGTQEPTCPHCLKIRHIAAESQTESQQYSEWAQQHVLPETAARRKELDAERQARIDYINKRMGKGKE